MIFFERLQDHLARYVALVLVAGILVVGGTVGIKKYYQYKKDAAVAAVKAPIKKGAEKVGAAAETAKEKIGEAVDRTKPIVTETGQKVGAKAKEWWQRWRDKD